VRKVNVKLVLSRNTATSLSSMGLLSIYVQSGWVSYLAFVELEDSVVNF